jgi:predicted metalloprotease with PDZ domain
MPDQAPLSALPPIPAPRDEPYCGPICLHVDATDIGRGIFHVRETIPAPRAGIMTLLYPKWLPGFHAPAASIELFAGLDIYAGDLRLAWRRDPVEVHAFSVDVPEDCGVIEARFQFLSPTVSSQGEITVTPAICTVHWSAMLLYPAGYYARGVEIEPSLVLPEGWTAATSLHLKTAESGLHRYAATPLNELVDAPVLAGRWTWQAPLDPDGAITLHLVADRPELLAARPQHIDAHARLVREADALFGARPFDRYEFLLALSDELGASGVEHRRSCEIVLPPTYFTAWDANAWTRDVVAHELVHAWNGKARRGVDSWSPSFEQPIGNSLMWVYEGLTQYWGEVLAARTGLWSPQQARDKLALTAALYQNRPGGAWRAMSDTTRDPIIAHRQPLPWPSWQRSEDYYAEGQLLWLELDTLIREASDDHRSLDHFAKAFFGSVDGQTPTSTYEFEDIVEALAALADRDWAALLIDRLERRKVGAPLEGLTRGGYRLVYRKHPSEFAMQADAAAGRTNLQFSIGVSVSGDGTLQDVIWEGPAFKAGAVTGAVVRAVNGRAFKQNLLNQAIADAEETGAIELVLERGSRLNTIRIAYADGNRFPHLEAVDGARARLDEILAPKAP